MQSNSFPRSRAADIDNYDLAIMSALTENAELTTIELSKLVHLSRTAVARRVAALRDAGVLGPVTAAVNYEKLGFSIRGLIEISAPKRDTFRVRDELLARPEVLSLSVVLGEHLMIAEVIAYDTKHLHQFLTWLHEFGFSETNVMLQHIESKMPLRDRLRLLDEKLADVDRRLTEINVPLEA
jgi:Lrp/AsnC family transcriptional regulator for asnA, asnC and gidA